MPSTFLKPVNLFKSTLASAHTSGSGTLVLAAGSGARLGTLPTNRIYRLTLLQDPDTSSEVVLGIIEAAGLSTDTLTGVTFVEGYTDGAIASGTAIEDRDTAKGYEDHSTSINTLETTIAGLGSAATHAASDFLTPTGSGASLTGITENQVTNLTTDLAARAQALVPTTVKTSAYTASPKDFVPVDTTAGSVTITLPTAPADGSRVAAKHVIQGGTNTVTVTCGGIDVFNKTGGSTSVTLTLLNQAVGLQYAASSHIWYVVADDLALAGLDGRYPVLASGLVPTANIPTTGLTVNTNTSPITTDTDGSTITFDCSVTNWHSVTLGGNRTLAVANVSVGQQFTLVLVQDGTGTRTVTWFSTIRWPGGIVPTLTTTPGNADIFTFKCYASGNFYGFTAGANL